MRRGMMLLLAALMCCMCATAFAHDVPDLSRTGTLNVTMKCDGTAIPGGSLTIFRAGEVSEDDGNFSFVLTQEFAASGAKLDDVQSADLAEALAKFAKDNKLAGNTKTIGFMGDVKFENLELGLYLVVQNKPADGYFAADAFLVSVPMLENGVYVYEVDATPKVELEKAPEPTDEPDEPDEKLPQTGQLNWPVPVMATVGVGLFSCGWALRFVREKDAYEE